MHSELALGSSLAGPGEAQRLREAGQLASAAGICGALLERDPAHAQALCILGRTLLDVARHARATHDGMAALADASGADETWAAPRAEREWLEEAEGLLRRATCADPSSVDAHLYLGRALARLARFGEADAEIRRAVALDRGNADLHLALADTQRSAGDYPGATATLERLVEHEPANVVAHLNLFATLYISGDYRRAWAENEWRLQGSPPPYPQPLWDGSSLEGRAILLLAEGGLGDQIQFVRWARNLRERGGRVIVQCPGTLRRLMLTCPGVDEVPETGAELPHFDVQVWSGSLPHLLGFDSLGSIPAEVPYLHADPRQVERWRTILGRFTGLRVGVNWAGNRYNLPGHNREIPFESFLALAEVPGVRLFSLQKGVGAELLEGKPADVSIADLGTYFVDMADTAAAIAALDLVVTNDTSIAHVAGALGRPVWLVLPRQACWRWQRGRDDCPWYPTMRLFRQRWDGTWGEVFAEVADALAREAALHAVAGAPRAEPVAACA